MAAAAALGASIPWTARATSPKMSLADMFFLSTFDKFARHAIALGHLRFILPNGEELVYGGAASAARSLPKGEPLGTEFLISLYWKDREICLSLLVYDHTPLLWTTQYIPIPSRLCDSL